MEYHVWLPDATDYVICESRTAMEYLVAQATGPVRVEVWNHSLLGVQTFGLQGGPGIPNAPKGNFQQVSINHVRQG